MTQPTPEQRPASEPVEPRYNAEGAKSAIHQSVKGMDKYGQELHTFNGRDAFRDAMEELIDLGRYVTQMQMEREYLEQLLARARYSLAFQFIRIPVSLSDKQLLSDILTGNLEVKP